MEEKSERKGLLQPSIRWRFRVRIDDYENLISAVAKCSVDYSSKTIKVTFRQPITGDLQREMLEIARLGARVLLLENLDSTNQTVTHSVRFFRIRCVKHRTKYNSGQGGPVLHKMVFNYTSADVKEIENKAPVS